MTLFRFEFRSTERRDTKEGTGCHFFRCLEKANENTFDESNSNAHVFALLNTPSFVCDECFAPVAETESIIQERKVTLKEAVYAYELDLLDKPVWSYSVTNPSADKFDVVLFSKLHEHVDHSVTGEDNSLHSWFPGFSWRNVSCGCCDMQLGWSFSCGKQVEFFALIVTRLRPWVPGKKPYFENIAEMDRIGPGGVGSSMEISKSILEHSDLHNKLLKAFSEGRQFMKVGPARFFAIPPELNIFRQ